MAQWEMSLGTNSLRPYSDIEDLNRDDVVAYPNFGLCLPRYSKLNGEFENVQKLSYGGMGYVSNELSNGNGEFTNPPYIDVKWARKKTSEGVSLVFNGLSGDYIKELTIEWYRLGKLISSKTYYPDSTTYTCSADVGLFDELKITFLKTSKPYRYAWVGQLYNNRLTKAGGIMIIYRDTVDGAKYDATITANSMHQVTTLDLLNDEYAPDHPHYAMGLPRYSKLDGSWVNYPIADAEPIAFQSAIVSDTDGILQSPVKMMLTLPEKITTVGLALYGNKASGDYASKVKITWYDDDNVLHTESYRPNNVEYFCEHKTEFYNKVLIEFLETSKPFRPVFVDGFDLGAIYTFTQEDITTASCLQEISPLSTELSINTLNFSIMNLKNRTFDFQKRQKINLYFDKGIVGKFYLKSGERSKANQYSFKTEDFISILDTNDYKGGIYKNAKALDLINDIFEDEDIDIIIDDALANKTVTGYIPYTSKRNALAQICFAIGAIVDTSFDDHLFIYPYQVKDTKAVNDNVIYDKQPTIKYEDIVTGVNLTVHTYTKNSKSNNLYEGELNGQAMVVFNDPAHSLSITGGAINEYGDNYAVISGTGSNVILSGMGYDHAEQVLTKEKENVYRDKKFADLKSCTLVSNDNGAEILARVFDYYANNQTLKMDVILDDLELSDFIRTNTYEGDKVSMINKLNMKFTAEIKASVEAKCVN